MKDIKKEDYMDSVHKSGRILNLTMLAVMLLFPIAAALVFKAVPDWHGLLLGLISTFPMYAAVGVVEVITYIPMLGAGGSYLSFVTGNISNLKLPCALNSLEQAGVKANSEEGEFISTISIAVSAPAEGLQPADVALISDIVTTQTSYDMTQIRVIEVK